ncbi:MAG: hypothetical protein NVSMB30_05380 [Hymenobacter sp.]
MVGVEAESNYLVTFGLALKYRTPDGLAELSRQIRILGGRTRPLRCCLYRRNQPARRFLLRMGFVPGADLLHPTTGQPGVLYTFTT